MKYIIILLFLLLTSFKKSIQRKINYDNQLCSKEEMPYISSKKLTWNDFSKTESRRDIVVAKTYSGFMFDYFEKAEIVDVRVCAYFNKPKSYVVSGKENEHVLNHEQKHFDITYLYSLKLIMKYRSQPELNNAIVKRLYDQTQQEWAEFEDRYDAETNHCTIKEKQLYWDKIIEDEVLALEREIKMQ